MIGYKMEKQKIAGEMERREKYILVRMFIVFGVCSVLFLITLGRAVYLHIVDNEDLELIANQQYNAKVPISVRRGKLFDRNGSELAVSLPVPSVYADPEKITDPVLAAEKLAPLLNMNRDELLKKLKLQRRFVWLKRRISYEILESILAQNIPGIGYIEESKRFYPNSGLASQILGAVGFDSQALGGIEMVYSRVLISEKTTTQFERDAKGRVYAIPAGFGDQSDVGNVYLTLDKQIQFITENALREAVHEYNAKDGFAVVMDPMNGEILAMASSSVFDPNSYSKYPVSLWRNRPVTDTFEPGSTFKVFVVAAALENGTVKPESVYDCENGEIRIGKDVLHDVHPSGKLTVQDIIKKSSNIGSLKVAFDLGKEKLHESLKKFQIGEMTGIGYPGEVSGILRNYSTWQPVENATIAFGQGLTVTPIQMTAAFAAAINGGNYYKPRLVSRIIERDGTTDVSGPEIISKPISKTNSDIMRSMLKRVVEKDGTGHLAYSETYAIGGKTGTAQKVIDGRYSDDKFFASFIGFAPVDDPKLVVFVGIDEPRGKYYGGTVAAPVVKEIIERSMNYMGVPSVKSKIMYTDTVMKEEDKPVITDVGQRDGRDFINMGGNKYLMPDLSGLTMRDVLSLAGKVNIDLDADGSGVALKQNPKAGSFIESGSRFSVKFGMPE